MKLSDLMHVSRTSTAGSDMHNLMPSAELMMELIGDHDIPADKDSYADLLDAALGVNLTDSEAEQQMMAAHVIVTHRNMHNRRLRV